jgi:hypothetical protein
MTWCEAERTRSRLAGGVFRTSTRPTLCFDEPSPCDCMSRERRVSVYEEAPGFRLGPRVVTRTQARGDRL